MNAEEPTMVANKPEPCCEATFVWNGIAISTHNLRQQRGPWGELFKRYQFMIDDARRRGPDSMIVSMYGEIAPYRESVEEYGIDADVVFFRDDGWSLGAPWNMRNIAKEAELSRWILEANMWKQTQK